MLSQHTGGEATHHFCRSLQHRTCFLGLLADPSMDLSKVELRAEVVEAAGGGDTAAASSRQEATQNTLYIGGLPTEWSQDQVGVVASVCARGPCEHVDSFLLPNMPPSEKDKLDSLNLE